MRQPCKLGKLFVVFLGLLLVVFMTVEGAHNHSNLADSGAATHCQLCATAHVPQVSKAGLLTSEALCLIGTVTVRQARPNSRLIIRTTQIRPPPFVEPALT